MKNLKDGRNTFQHRLSPSHNLYEEDTAGQKKCYLLMHSRDIVLEFKK